LRQVFLGFFLKKTHHHFKDENMLSGFPPGRP